MPSLPSDPNASFTQTSLDQGGFSLRKLLVASMLGALTLVLIIGAIMVVPQLANMGRAAQPNGRNTGPFSVSNSTTPTVAPKRTDALASPWQHDASFDTILSIDAAPSQPNTAYACYQVIGNGAGIIGMLALQNGGSQWSLLTKDIAPGYGCQVSVDPTDARDVAVTIDPCPANACLAPPQTFNSLYRSHDGGASWQAMRLPKDDPIVGFGPNLAWSGANLLDETMAVRTQVTAQHPLHQLALSVSGRAFVWADHNGVLTNSDSGPIELIGGLPGILYAGLLPTQSRGTACFDPPYANLVTSRDLGQTWQPLIFTSRFGYPNSYVKTAPDGQRLIGYDDLSSQYAISSDEGKTWVELPPVQPFGPCGIWVAPDGTTVANLVRINTGDNTGEPSAGLALCAPKGHTWQSLPNSQDDRVTPFAVTYDAHGHPSRVWAFFRPNATTQEVVDYPVN